MKKKPMTRFLSFAVYQPSGCIGWRGHQNTGGYSRFFAGGRLWCAHRWYWEQINGPVPTGMQLDHLCRNRWCVNPDHLEVVTNRENCLRSPIGHAAKTECKHGHLLCGDNVFPKKSKYGTIGRGCRECRKNWMKKANKKYNAKVREVKRKGKGK